MCNVVLKPNKFVNNYIRNFASPSDVHLNILYITVNVTKFLNEYSTVLFKDGRSILNKIKKGKTLFVLLLQLNTKFTSCTTQHSLYCEPNRNVHRVSIQQQQLTFPHAIFPTGYIDFHS